MIRDGETAWRIEAHAIVSADGRISRADGTMPPGLMVEADQVRFQDALDRAVLTVLGREGHERHPPRGRRRLVLTSRVDGVEGRGTVTFWNPEGASIAEALRVAAPEGGRVVNAGGSRVMTFCLPWTSAFDLAVATRCEIPGGRPCLTGCANLEQMTERLIGAGLYLTRSHTLDEVERVVLHCFERGG